MACEIAGVETIVARFVGGATEKAGHRTVAAQNPEPLLVTRALEVGYDGEAILPAIDLRIGRKEFWSVIGPNGAGKSTFVRTLLGLDRPVRGSVTRAPDLRPCYVPQQATLDPIFPIKVLDFVLMGALERGKLLGPAGQVEIEAALQALAEVRAADLRRRLLRDLSGGQRQRVLLARALAARANLYVLDEPTAALDVASEREVLELVGALTAGRGATVVMITHMLEDALQRADQILFLDREHGLALAGPPREIVKSPGLQRLYGPVMSPKPNPNATG